MIIIMDVSPINYYDGFYMWNDLINSDITVSALSDPIFVQGLTSRR
jgi:hypothetical protein